MNHNNDMIKLVRLVEGKQNFAGEEVGQKPGDQVRGTDKAKVGGKDHPFKGRLVGEDTTLEDVLSKKYQDFKELQAKEKAEKKKEKEGLDEVSLGDYRKKAGMQKAQAGMGAMFGRSPEERARELATYKKREKGLERVKARDERARKAEQERHLADLVARLPELKAEYEEMRKQYKALGGSDWQYADREQNLTDAERRARAMEGPMNNLWRDIQAAEKAQKSQGMKEGYLDRPGQEDSPVTQAITRRILLQRTDLLSKHGPEKVAAAIDAVADFVGDVDEIGSSDVSGWVKQVERELGGVAETKVNEAGNVKDAVLDCFKQIHAGAKSGEDMIDYLADELSDYYKSVRASGDAQLKKAYQYMMDNGQEAEGDPQAMAQVAQQAIGMLSSMPEAAPGLVKAAAGLAVGGIAAAGAPAIVGILGPLLGIPMAAYGAYSAAKLGMKGVEKLWDMAADKLGGDDKVTQYTRAKIAKLPPDQARAASATVNQLGENRKKQGLGRTISELGATPPPAPTGTATAAPTAGNTTPTSGSVSPDEQTALNKIQTNPVMKQQLDKLMTQATPGAANKPMELNPEQEDALEKIKANAGLKTQYDKIIKQANPQAKV